MTSISWLGKHFIRWTTEDGDLPLGANNRLYYICICCVLLYEKETWSVIEEDVIRLEKNSSGLVSSMCNIRPEERISAGALRTRLKFNSMRECLQDRRLQ